MFAQISIIANLPLLEILVVGPFLGAIWVAWARDVTEARRRSIVAAGGVLAVAFLLWSQFVLLGDSEVSGVWLNQLVQRPIFVVDLLSAPLLVLTSLVFFATPLVTIRTKMPRFSFAGALLGEGFVLGMMSCREPMTIAILLSINTLLPLYELRARRKPTRIFLVHAIAFIATMVTGTMLLVQGFPAGTILIAVGVAIRTGLAPFHLWISDFCENASFGRCLVFLTPMPAAYVVCRLLIPTAPAWLLTCLGFLALATAVYAAGMALVQNDLRRFFSFFFISHSALVFVGLENASPAGLTGSLSVWLSSGVALAGFGLTLRAIEARHGKISLDQYHGLQSLSRFLAPWYLVSGLACVGFPGTLGFVSSELVLDAALQSYPIVGISVVVAMALNGIAVVKTYFVIFAGKRSIRWLPEVIHQRERIGVYTFSFLLIVGGIIPQPFISSRFRAASELLKQRSIAPSTSLEHEITSISIENREPL